MPAAPRSLAPTRRPQATSSTLLVERIRRGVERAEQVPLVASEELEGEDLASLREEVIACVDETQSLLSDLLCELAPEEAPDELDLDWGDRPSAHMAGELERRMEEPTGIARATNVAFIAQIGLRGRREQLRAATTEKKWELIAACGSAQREILKSLSAIELAIAEHEGRPAASRYYVSEIARAIEVRHVYWTFRAEVQRSGVASPHDSGRRLRSAATALAKLVGRSAYPYARVSDRCQIRDLQRRLRTQLTAWAHAAAGADGGAADLELAAARLWQDVANLSELLMQVNHRGELREHDRVRFEEALRQLDDGDIDGARRRLRDVLGRDGEVDEAVRSGVPAEILRTRVAAALQHLTRAGDSTTPNDASTERRRKTDAPLPGGPS